VAGYCEYRNHDPEFYHYSNTRVKADGGCPPSHTRMSENEQPFSKKQIQLFDFQDSESLA
jgi:hypothetical protein